MGPVLANMVRRQHATDEGCPNCGVREDTDHIFTCKSPGSEDIFRSQAEILKLHLQDTTSKQLQLIIMELVTSFRETREPAHLDVDNVHAGIIVQQYGLGVRAFLGGFWSKQIVSVQTSYFRHVKSSKLARKWTAQTIILLQSILMEI